MRNKYTREMIAAAVKESISVAEVLRKLGVRETGGSHSHISRKIREVGREYKCEICNWDDQWNGKTLRLEVDHIDSNWLNDSETNLRFICPNCHSQQPHKSNQGMTDLTSNARYCRESRAKKVQVAERYTLAA